MTLPKIYTGTRILSDLRTSSNGKFIVQTRRYSCDEELVFDTFTDLVAWLARASHDLCVGTEAKVEFINNG